MRIVVTGREGQVVRSLLERGSQLGLPIVSLGRPTLDLANGPDGIVGALLAERPDVIVSAAAYTAVDKAETEPELAFAINERGAAAIAHAAHRMRVPLIHLSTDYVFDGRKSTAYNEDDVTNPTGIYGASKLAGERAVLSEHDNVAILRTAWVYSPFGVNFVKTMLRLANDRDEVRVVADQRGNPTSALDIAEGILAVAANLVAAKDPEQRGVFHLTASGEASWAEFADEIFAASGEARGPVAKVIHIATSEYPTAAERPPNSRLDSAKLARVHGVRLPQWRASVSEVVKRLVHPAN